MNTRFFAGIIAAAVLLVGGHAGATTIVVGFDGFISFSGGFIDPTGNFSPGDPLSGFWTVDTATADTDPVSTRGAYPQSGAPAFQIDIGSHTFSTATMTIQILDNHTLGIGTIDAYDVLGGSGVSTVLGLTVNQMQITLRDTVVPLDALSSDALPSTAPDPLSFDQVGQATAQITGNVVGSQFFMNLEIDSTRVIGASALDHFVCYKVKEPKGVPKFDEQVVKLDDQFSGGERRVRKPKSICVPVDKNGEGIQSPEAHLVCYEIKQLEGDPKLENVDLDVLVTNQFGKQILSVRKPKTLCVPSTKEVLDFSPLPREGSVADQ